MILHRRTRPHSVSDYDSNINHSCCCRFLEIAVVLSLASAQTVIYYMHIASGVMTLPSDTSGVTALTSTQTVTDRPMHLTSGVTNQHLLKLYRSTSLK